MSDIVCLTTNVRAICGESPVWSNAEKVVYWVDITGRKIYWTVLYGGSTLIRITPDGEIDQQISLPVSQPTMPAFGGADMKTIFITSATQHMDENAIEAEAFAGELIMLETEFEGSPEGAFGG